MEDATQASRQSLGGLASAMRRGVWQSQSPTPQVPLKARDVPSVAERLRIIELNIYNSCNQGMGTTADRIEQAELDTFEDISDEVKLPRRLACLEKALGIDADA